MRRSSTPVPSLAKRWGMSLHVRLPFQDLSFVPCTFSLQAFVYKVQEGNYRSDRSSHSGIYMKITRAVVFTPKSFAALF